MTGKQYAVRQIESIGTNMIDVEYQSGGEDTSPDLLPSVTCMPFANKLWGSRPRRRCCN